jgi:hypothetical protein
MNESIINEVKKIIFQMNTLYEKKHHDDEKKQVEKKILMFKSKYLLKTHEILI